jgi:hypothetical protein
MTAMTSDELAGLFARFCFSAPLLYIGLRMSLDPADFVRSLEALAGVLDTFRERI